MTTNDMPSLFPGVTVERDVVCAMRDGVLLCADVYRPDGDSEHPVLLHRTPYGMAAESDVAYAHPSWYARHGYVVVVQDCRGRWRSGGDFYPFLHEAEDGYDAVEWAARLPGADGRVGMYGFSYAGATQLLAATLRPPSLGAIAPALTPSQYYDGWTYNHGALALAFAASWATSLAIGDAARRSDVEAVESLSAAFASAHDGYSALPVTRCLDAGLAPYFRDWLEHSTYDDYWRRWSIDEDYGRITVPALHVAGLYDIFLSGTVRNFNGLRAGAGDESARRAQKLLIAPLAHMPWSAIGAPGPGIGADAGANLIDDWHLRWFEHLLKGRDTGVLDAAATAWVLGDGWRDFDAWPPAESRAVAWFLRSHGRANTAAGDGALSQEAPGDEPPDVYVHDPMAPVPSQGGHSCCVAALTPMGPACQCASERLKVVLVYTTPPLERDIELAGDASVILWAATSAADADFTARLCLVDGDGCSRNLQEGIVRAAFRDSLSHPMPIEAGRPYEYRIELGPVAARIPAGSRIRLDVASSDFPQWDRNLGTGARVGVDGMLDAVVSTQVVLHDAAHPSRLTLPILDSR